MTSSRPYLIRALYEWINDNNETPHILVNTEIKGVEVPKGFDNDGEIVLNLSPGAVNHLRMNNDKISFVGGFKGVKHNLVIPTRAVRAVYSRETGQGMIFDELEDDSEEPVFATTEETLTVDVRKAPSLRIVK